MTTAMWATLFLVLYVAVTTWLTRAGAKKTNSFAAFAASGAQLGVIPTALVAAACLTSTATFSINPGFVYAEGLAAFIAFSIPVALGVTLAFFTLGPRLRETSVGPDGSIKVLTLPEWVGRRFDSKKLRSLFAVLVLALFSYAILILVGAGYVASATLGVKIEHAIIAIMAFVVAYTTIGGTHAHASTNVVKGGLLLFAATAMGAAAARELFSGATPLAKIEALDPALLAPFRAGSARFANVLDVLIAPLVIGFALACQPHILVKVLYVKDPRAIRKTGLATGAIFLLLGAPALLSGLAARAALGATLRQDAATALWVTHAFRPALAALIGVIMIAAAIGTLNALLLALGSTFAHDVARPLVAKVTGRASSESSALAWGRIATVMVGIAVVAFAYSPPKLVWITGVMGVYALVEAACPAVLVGCMRGATPHAGFVGVAAIVGPAVHGVLYGTGISANPNVTGAAGVVTGLAIVMVGKILAGMAIAENANENENENEGVKTLEKVGV